MKMGQFICMQKVPFEILMDHAFSNKRWAQETLISTLPQNEHQI